MTIEGLFEKLVLIETSLAASVMQCNKNCEMLGRIDKALAELRDTRKQLISVNSMEEQTITVVRRLTDKWRENTDEISRLRESMEHVQQSNTAMQRSFDILYERLRDVLSCPMRPEDAGSASPAPTNPNV